MASAYSDSRDRRETEDTDPILAGSDSDTVYEDDEDNGYDERKTSAELRREDHSLLEEEEEREKLIARSASGRGTNTGLARLFRKDGNTTTRGARRKSKKGPGQDRRQHLRSAEESELMYDTEEGGRLLSAPRDSFEADEQRLHTLLSKKKRSSKPRFLRASIYLFISLLFFILLFAAYRASGLRPTKHYATLLHNGTSGFAPTTILISLDGFRADFLQRNLTPTMQAFVNEGVSPPYMNPSFPSVTFPNHWTLATGLYPETHGIVGNTFWDPDYEQEFYYTHKEVSMQSKWWGGDSLWSTAERQGIRTAVHMWPGSEAEVGEFQPSHIDKYNGSEKLSVKVDRILSFLDLPGPDSPHALADQPRPQLIAAYVPNVDSDGHRYGPNSTEIRATIRAVDTMLGDLFQGLEERNLTDIVNVVIVSDHGMATTDVSRLIQLEDLIDTNLVEHIDGWPLYGLRPKNPDNLDRLYQELKFKAEHNPNIEVYLRDFDMPERYHFVNNDRIAPLWIVPKTGWAIVTKDEFDIQASLKTGATYEPHGLHGYDHEHPLMRAIFIARGPAFPHKPGSRLEPFQNIQLYNIICDSIGAEPAPNNGTFRLPLKPVGLHSDVEADETPDDPPASTTLAGHVLVAPPSAVASTASAATSATAATTAPTKPSGMSTEEAEPVYSEDEEEDGGKTDKNGGDEDEEKEEKSWWEWFTDKVNDAKGWALNTAHKAGDKIEEVKGKIGGGKEKEGES